VSSGVESAPGRKDPHKLRAFIAAAKRARADVSAGAVLVSFWRRDEVSATAGTSTEWLWELPNVVELYCACSPTVAADRFLARTRHHGHGDALRSRDELMAQFEALAPLGPLGVGRVVEVDTEHAIDIGGVIAELFDTSRDSPG
jgi:hypothetical protein